MTNKEAIEELDNMLNELYNKVFYNWDTNEYKVRKSNAFRMAIEALSAERTGYWIEGQTAGQRFVKCSCCGHIEFDGTPNYCEDCGAKMVEGEEE